MSRQVQSIQQQLQSPLHTTLGQAVEVLGQAIHSDVAAACLFEPGVTEHKRYVSVRNVRLTASQHAQLMRWPGLSPSIFTAVRDRPRASAGGRGNRGTRGGRAVQAASGLEAVLAHRLDRQHLSEASLLRLRMLAISAALAPVDGLALCLSLDSRCVCPMVFLRCGHSVAFNKGELDTIASLHSDLERLLRQARTLAASSDALLDGTPDHVETLSPTERRIFNLLLSHHTERDIAESLRRSPHTVHVHVKNIYRKLRINSRKQLVDAYHSPHGDGKK